MPPRHSWESPSVDDDDSPARGAAELPLHPWEGSEVATDSNANGSEDERSDADGNEDATAGAFIQHMIMLYLRRTLTAVQFCEAMCYAGLAGIPSASKYGHRPGAPSGHYQRHLSKVLPEFSDVAELYTLRVPGSSTSALGRAKLDFVAMVPHEVIDKDLRADPASVLKVREAIDENVLPPSYDDHHVVLRHRAATPVLPVSLYIDGVPYSLTDSVIGLWFVSELTGRRYLIAALRKKRVCACGCRGWCSYQAIFRFIAWSLAAMAEGVYPRARHDGAPWGPRDATRAALAGTPLKLPMCLLFVKGDWAEYAATLGFPSWQDGLRPCFGCNAAGPELYNHDGFGPASMPFRSNMPGDYEAACRGCEVLIVLDGHWHKVVLEHLAYDKRPQGSHGRALLQAIPELGLARDDRLEPSEALTDVGDFDSITTFPIPVVFWRPAAESMTRHRNPIFDPRFGVWPSRAMTVDALHALYLGVMKQFCCTAVWFLLSNSLWGQVGTTEESLSIAVLALRHSLMVWYRQRHQQHPTERLTRVGSLTRKMLGEPGDRHLKTKGAETWGILLFVTDMLDKHQGRLPGDAHRLRVAGMSLTQMVELFGAHGVRMPPAAIQACFDLYERHMALTDSIPELLFPKRHIIMHMLEATPYFGNPRFRDLAGRIA